jgi:hypothetical protein
VPIRSSQILQNSQCSVDTDTSPVTISGNTLTLYLAVTAKSGFVGAKNIYMEVENAAHDSGWSLMGAWTVP